jgi:hypothetical protein
MKIKLDSSIGGKSLSPGPAGYNVHLKNKKEAPKFGFGTSTRDQMGAGKHETPGPGAYKINSRVGDVPTYSGIVRDDK